MSGRTERIGVHLVVGGYPPGEPAGHDMDYARRSLLELLGTDARVHTTVANDFADLDRWLDRSRLLVTYVAGPFPDEAGNDALGRLAVGRGALAGAARHERRQGGTGAGRPTADVPGG